MDLTRLLVVLATVYARVVADWQSPQTYCVYGCYAALQFTDFLPEVDYSPCAGELGIKSLIYCAQIYCANDHIIEGLNAINTTCSLITGEWLPSRESIVGPLPPGTLDNVTRISYPAGLKHNFTEPAVPDVAFYKKGYQGEAGFYNNINISLDFAWSLYGFWGLVLFIGFCNHAYCYLTEPLTAAERNRRILPGSTAFRRFLLLPSTVGTHSQQPLWGLGTIPPRLESIILLLYFVLNLVTCFPAYGLVKGDLFSPAISGQIIKYSGDRTGILALANFPLIWVFSARNNPFLWLTGWSFSTFNHFHRWIARGTVILVIVHSAIYTVSERKAGDDEYREELKEPYFYVGVIGTVVLSLMLPLTIYIFRAKFYDAFLITHILFALGVLVATYYHLDLYDFGYLGQYTRFIWPPVAVWAADRLLRIVRVAYHAANGTMAYASYDADAQIVRLDVSHLLRGQSDGRGQYYFVYCPTMLLGWESHPFTLCTWPDTTHEAPSSDSEKGDVHAPKERRTTSTFLIRPYSGFTNRLRKAAGAAKSPVESQASIVQVKVLLEGPYGIRHDVSGFSTVLMIVGGSGITPAIPYTHDLLSNANKTGVSVRIVWALPQRAFADNVCRHELASAVAHQNFKLDVYLTPGQDSKPELKSAVPYSVFSEQPDIEALVREARKNCEGSLAVLCCGPPRMADNCRQAVVSILAEPGPLLEFYNETLTW